MLKKLNQFTESHGALRPGRGLITGVIALTLAILCFLGVMAFHFPQYLTTPELRKQYDIALMRQLQPLHRTHLEKLIHGGVAAVCAPPSRRRGRSRRARSPPAPHRCRWR